MTRGETRCCFFKSCKIESHSRRKQVAWLLFADKPRTGFKVKSFLCRTPLIAFSISIGYVFGDTWLDFYGKKENSFGKRPGSNADHFCSQNDMKEKHITTEISLACKSPSYIKKKYLQPFDMAFDQRSIPCCVK